METKDRLRMNKNEIEKLDIEKNYFFKFLTYSSAFSKGSICSLKEMALSSCLDLTEEITLTNPLVPEDIVATTFFAIDQII